MTIKTKLLRLYNRVRLQFTVTEQSVYEVRIWRNNVTDMALIFFIITPILGVGVVVLTCYLIGPYGFNPKPLP